MDYFVAPLSCPKCEATSPDDGSTNMTTYIRDEPQLAYLRAGDLLKVNLDAINERGYLTIHRPQPGEAVRILHEWECPACGTNFNWAEIVVRDDRIESIEAVDLNRETIDRANYLHDEAKGVAAVLTDRSYFDISDDEVVPLLRKLLPAGKVEKEFP